MQSNIKPISTFEPEASHHDEKVTIPEDFIRKADEVITHYPVSKRSASLPLLHLWQEKYGYISNQAVHWIAEKLDLQPIQILELVTFYPMFRQHAIGKFQIKVCRTLSCALAGSYKTFEKFKTLTGATIEEGHGIYTSHDKKFSVEFVECLASCGTGPVIMVNEDFYEAVDEKKIQEVLQKCN